MSKNKLARISRGDCSEIISSGKYHNTYHESKARWNKQFKEMDDRRSVPFYKRMKHLKECFSEEMLQDLLDIGIEVHDEPVSADEIPSRKSTEEKVGTKLCPSDPDFERPSTPPNRVRHPNPYLNFMKKSEDEAQIWRPAPKPDFKDLHLTKKADLLFENIVSEFYEWFTEVRSGDTSEYDKETILELFQVPCPYPIAKSIDNQMQILGSVPSAIAQRVHAPEEFRIRQEMANDRAAMRRPERLVAFGKTLPAHLKQKPMIENFMSKLLEADKLDKDVVSLAYVWKDITNLYITKAYADWLDARSNLEVPQYLVDEGIFDKEITKIPMVDQTKLDKLKNSKAYMKILGEDDKK